MEFSRPPGAGASVAGRYLIEEVLGRGGMATVYLALDQHTGQRCALKRGSGIGSRKTRRRVELLEREYHTLAQLAHPSIIEVYEYGVDADGPYYTMELLQGSDLDAQGRRPWKEACALLYDVASSLAILHARGLLHRDLSLRNIRCSPEGRAKLIDFGAMAPMGVAKDVQGTAPFLAPEVIQLQELDARTDLFSLGAVGYYLLTGRHAFPARRMSELRDVWRSRPTPPARVASDVPIALSALIVQLLMLDRNARPRSAAEVMERLCAIADLPPEEHAGVSRAYLTTPALVGRDHVRVQVRRKILGLVRREGGTLLIEGNAGSGRSRMLDACVLEGKLLGTVVVRADAGDAAQGDWGVARALCRQLAAQLPVDAPETARLSHGVLAHVLDELDGDLPVSGAPPERRLLLRELRDYVLAFARSRQLLIAIDDIDKIDEPSAALLAAIANKAERTALLLVAAVEREQGPSMSAPLRLLRLLGRPVELPPLQPAETEALLQSIFGDVPYVQSVAARVHTLAQGNPRAMLDIAQHLVERGLARYQAGSWLLPARLDEGDLPASLADALAARLSVLSPNARALCEVQALADGDSLDVAAYAELAGIAEHKRIFAALDELSAARVFSADGDGYRFSQRGFVAVTLASFPEVVRRGLHSRIADRLYATNGDIVRRADHLLQADRGREAIDLLCSIDLHARLPPVSVLERAIEQAERHAVPLRTRHALRSALLSKASLVLAAESFRRHLPSVLERLERDSGLALYRELSDLPAAERLQQALTRTQAAYMDKPEHERVHSVIDAIGELGRLSAALCSIASQLFELELLDTLPSLEPFAALSPAVAIVTQVVEAAKHWISGRQDRYAAIAQRLTQRLAEPDRGGLDPALQRRTLMGFGFGLGLFEASRGCSAAEAQAVVLEKDRGYRVNAWRIRMVMHLRQGNFEEANKCERRAELLYLQDHSEQSYAGMGSGAEVTARAEAGDLLGVKSALQTLEALAQRYPGWRPVYMSGLCRYRWLQGDLPGALHALLPALRLTIPGRHNGFALLAALHVRLLGQLGRTAEAIARAREVIAICEREQLFAMLDVVRAPLAESLAVAGEHAEAVEMIEAVIAAAEHVGRAGLALGSLYEGRARIAIHMHDAPAFERAAERCAAEYQKARNPALGARFAQLLDAARQQGIGVAEAVPEYRELLQLTASESEYNSIHSRILECVDGADRARCALSLLLQSSDSAAGYLFGVNDAQVVLMAALPETEAERELHAWVQECVQSALASDEAVTGDAATETQSSSALRYLDREGRVLEPLFLIATESERGELAAVLVLHVPSGARTLPSRPLLNELACELLEHGDVRGMRLTAAGPDVS
jgi:predicted ATPase